MKEKTIGKISVVSKIQNIIFAWGGLTLLMCLMALGFSPDVLNIPMPQPTIFSDKVDFSFIFVVCILGPLWEELVFRVAPVKLLRFLKVDNKVLWLVMLAICCIFGINHGSPYNIYYQGVVGAGFTWLYIKNGDCFWSAVTLHGLWNFCLVFLLKYLL